MGSDRQKRIESIIWAGIFLLMTVSPLRDRDIMLVGAFFLMPVPLIVLNVRVSIVTAGILVAAVTGAFLLIRGVPDALLFLVLVGAWSQLVGFMIRRRSRYSRVLFWGTVLAVGGLLLARLVAMGLQLPTDKDSLAQLFWAADTALNEGRSGGTGTGLGTFQLVPFFVIYILTLYSAANFFLAKWVLGQMGVRYEDPPRMEYFQLPDYFLQGALLAVMLSWGCELLDPHRFGAAMDTVVYLLAMLAAAQGLGAGAFLLEKWGVPPLWRNILVLALFFLMGPFGLAIAGCLDLVLDFRRQRHRSGGE